MKTRRHCLDRVEVATAPEELTLFEEAQHVPPSSRPEGDLPTKCGLVSLKQALYEHHIRTEASFDAPHSCRASGDDTS